MPPSLPGLPPSPLEPVREIIKQGRQQLEKARDDIRSLAQEIGSMTHAPETTQTLPTENEEECPACSTLTNLREFLGRRRVKKALSELEASESNEGKRKSLETVRKYVEGEDIV